MSTINYTKIEVTKVTKNVYQAKTKFWLDDSKIKIDANMSGISEEHARDKLILFLSGKGDVVLNEVKRKDSVIKCDCPHLHNYEIDYYGNCSGCGATEK